MSAQKGTGTVCCAAGMCFAAAAVDDSSVPRVWHNESEMEGHGETKDDQPAPSLNSLKAKLGELVAQQAEWTTRWMRATAESDKAVYKQLISNLQAVIDIYKANIARASAPAQGTVLLLAPWWRSLLLRSLLL